MSMSMTLGHQSSTSRKKDLKKCLRTQTHISKKLAHLLLYFLVQTSMTNYKMNCSETWSVVFHQWSIPAESGTKVKQVILKSLSLCARTYGMAKTHELLGITLMFIHPERFEFFKVSAGLVHMTGKKAAGIAHDTLNELNMCSITQ